jgi:hypothetical protein
MNCQFWVNPTPTVLDRLLPGVRDSDLIPLWILPDDNRFPAEMLEAVVTSVKGLRCALWRLNGASNRSPEEIAQHGAFVKFPELIDGFLARCELQYSEYGKSLEFWNSTRLCADVAWFASGQWELLSQFTSESCFGNSSAIAFLPPVTAEAQRWANSVIGYFWHMMNCRFASCTATPLLPSDAISLSILRLTAQMRGIATKICCDSNMQKALVLWASEDQIRAVAGQLDSVMAAGDETTFQRWIGRGVAFVENS